VRNRWSVIGVNESMKTLLGTIFIQSEVSFDLCSHHCGVQPSLSWMLALSFIALLFIVAGGISRSKGKAIASWSYFLVAAAFIVAAYQFG